MRILVVHEVDYLEKVIYEIHEFPEMLAAHGHEVTFFQFQEVQTRNQLRPFRQLIEGRVVKDSTIDLRSPHQFGHMQIDRLWATLACIPALVRMFREKRFDVVLNYAVPTYGLQVLLIAWLFKVPLVHRALDVSHEIRQSIYKYPILWVEKILYRIVGQLSANNQAMANYCINLSGRTKPTTVNYPPLDLAHFYPRSPDASLLESLGIKKGDKVITYMGSFFYFSGLPECIGAFESIAATKPELKLLLIGGGEQEAELKEIVSKSRVRNQVVFTGFVSYSDLPEYLALATVAINPLQITQVASVAFPHKVLQYLAMGLPVVSTRLSGLESALDGHPNLTWVESSLEVIEGAIKEIDRNKKREGLGLGIDFLERLFSPEHVLKSMEATLTQAIKTYK